MSTRDDGSPELIRPHRDNLPGKTALDPKEPSYPSESGRHVGDKKPMFPLKEEGKATEFNRWLVELMVKLILIAAGVGATLCVLFLSFEQQRELLKMNLHALQQNLDTSLATQKAMLDTALNNQAASLSITLSEQQRLLERSLRGQVRNQQRLDRIRLINVLKQIRGEIGSNIQHITDEERYGLMGMRLQLELKDETVLLSYSPDWRFKTTIWENANTKDYFIAHRPLSIYNLAAVYEEFSQFNRFADEFNEQVLLMRSMASRDGSARLEFENTFRFTSNLKEAANQIVDSLKSAQGEFDNRIERDIRQLEAKN